MKLGLEKKQRQKENVTPKLINYQIFENLKRERNELKKGKARRKEERKEKKKLGFLGYGLFKLISWNTGQTLFSRKPNRVEHQKEGWKKQNWRNPIEKWKRDQKENNPETDLRLITCWVVLQTELGEEAEMVAEAAATEAAKNPGFFIFFFFVWRWNGKL